MAVFVVTLARLNQRMSVRAGPSPESSIPGYLVPFGDPRERGDRQPAGAMVCIAVRRAPEIKMPIGQTGDSVELETDVACSRKL